MKITSKALAAVVFFVIFGGIFATTALGWWKTENTKEAAKFSEGEFAGLANPADIRGSYTFGDIERNFGIPAATMAEAFVITESSNPAEVGVKDLETLYLGRIPADVEIGTSSVRWFVALYTGVPYTATETVWLPRQAVEILLRLGTLSSADIALVNERAVDLLAQPIESIDPVQPADESTAVVDTVTATEHAVADRTMRGKTTFQELLDWGLTADQIAAVLGASMPAPGMLVKDYCTSKGIEYVTVKDALQVLLDALP